MKILFFIEPFPIRETLAAYHWVASNWLQVAASAASPEKGFHYFSNAVTIAWLQQQNSKLPNPVATAAFTAAGPTLEHMVRYWSSVSWEEAGALGWRGVLTGHGEFSAAVIAELARVKVEKFDFDAVALWGQNLAVRQFCEANGIVCINCELGATREPLPTSFYFDPWGCHGAGFMSRIPTADLPEPDSDWETLLDKVRLARQRNVSQPLALVALQTSDDANFLGHPSGPIDMADDAEGRIRSLLQSGYRVVIKTHPGAAAYRWTRRAEARLLGRVSSLEKVAVVRELPAERSYLDWLASFDIVAGLSSSLVFEAALAGAPTALDGQTSFAARDSFCNLSEALQHKQDWNSRAAALRRNASFYLSAFAKFEISETATVLSKIASLHKKHAKLEPDDEYTSDWVSQFAVKPTCRQTEQFERASSANRRAI